MHGTLLGALKSGLKRRRDRRDLARTAAQLAHSQEYSFTQDWMSKQVEHWRQSLEQFAGRAGIRMLEIGSYEGRSAVWFLENILTHPTSRLVCVDPFFGPPQEIRFDHNVKCSGSAARVDKRRARSEEVLPQLEPESFDLIYLDGSHEAPNVLFDGMLSWGLLKPGGVLIFDDYLWEPQLLAEHVHSLQSTCSSVTTAGSMTCSIMATKWQFPRSRSHAAA